MDLNDEPRNKGFTYDFLAARRDGIINDGDRRSPKAPS